MPDKDDETGGDKKGISPRRVARDEYALERRHTVRRGKPKKDDEKDAKKGDDKKDDGKGKKKSPWPIIIIVAVVLLLVIGGMVFYLLTKDETSTDDAYTEGNAINVAPKVAGYVVERRVDDNTYVKAGDLMLRIDPRDYIASRDQAKANLDNAVAQLASSRVDLETTRVKAPASLEQSQAQLQQAQANLTNAQREDKRQRSVDPRATTQSNVDQANTTLKSNDASVNQAAAQVKISSLVEQSIESAELTVKQREAQVEQAKANLASAELNVGYTEMRAPFDGYVVRRNFDVGSYLQAGQQIFYFVQPLTWVVANFKETQLDRMRQGQRVRIDVDAYPDLKLRGHVDSIQQGSGARFTTFPSENATGNYVKIVRRVPVKIVLDSGVDQTRGLPLGLSVEPTVDLR